MKTNFVIAPISASQGMAGSMRVRNLVNELRNIESYKITNLIIDNTENQIDKSYYDDKVSSCKFPYHSKLANLPNIRNIYLKLKELKRGCNRHVLYYYNINHNPFDFLVFIVAKLLGYKILFDEVELYHTKLSVSNGSKYLKILIISLNQFLIKSIADHIFCISNSILKYYSNNSSLLPISYSSNLASLPEKEITNTPIILYSGSFAEKDNIKMLLLILKKIKDQRLSFKLLLTGRCSDEQKKDIIRSAIEFEIQNEIELKGFLSAEEYFKVLANADICVVPRDKSKFSAAGFPFKLGEFLAAGKAVIVSNTGDVPLYLTSDDVIIIEPNSEKGLQDALINLISNKELRKKLSINGRKKAFSYFNPRVHSQHIANVIDNFYQ